MLIPSVRVSPTMGKMRHDLGVWEFPPGLIFPSTPRGFVVLVPTTPLTSPVTLSLSHFPL